VLYIALNSEAKTHILAGVDPGENGRDVTTVCGLVHPESDFRYATEDDSNVCSRCSGKVDVPEAPEAEEVVVDLYPAPVVESAVPSPALTTKSAPSKK
jgi:hypothetical protein